MKVFSASDKSTSVRSLMAIVVIAAMGTLVSSQVFAADSDAQLQMVRKKVAGMFDTIAPENVGPSPLEGWYKIQKSSIVAYISADGHYLLQGDLIDLDTQVNLSEKSRDEARRALMSTVSDKDEIKFTPKKVKYSVAVFTDVECTYCRKLHSQINDYLAQGIEIRYLLYPRNGPKSSSWNTSEAVWCSNDHNKALTLAKLDKTFETTKCKSDALEHTYQLGQEVGLNGTPTIVLDDGEVISGYLPPQALLQRLQAEGQDTMAQAQP